MENYIKKSRLVKAKPYELGDESCFKCYAYEPWHRTECTFSCGNGKKYRDECLAKGRAVPFVKTPFGLMRVSLGDYIVVEDGETFVYSKEDFEENYYKA